MPLLEEIQQKVLAGRFEFSKHAVDQMIVRRIGVGEVREAMARGRMIEDYPDDKYGPSCLVFGLAAADRPLHVQCSYPSRALVKIITVYEPDPAHWVDFAERRT